jgi:hypothetical protein
MTSSSDNDAAWTTEQAVIKDFQQQPHLFLRLTENALTVAESLRHNYFRNTTEFIRTLRRSVDRAAERQSPDPVLTVAQIADADWSSLQGEVVTFIDGGFGQVQISSQVPILLRVGSYCVRTGERRLSEREQFGYYPVILGDLEGGSKERKDFPDIVRITAELLGGLAALERTPDLRVLMFHGPLVYQMTGYAGHRPFTEADIDLFLAQYATDRAAGQILKDEFLQEARLDIYPSMMEGDHYQWVEQRLFEPLAWLAYLYRRLIRIALARSPVPIIAGVVERGNMRDFSRNILLRRAFRKLELRGKSDYFNRMYGRDDLNTPQSLLDRLGYTDSLLLGMLLRPGEVAESWEMAGKYDNFQHSRVALPAGGTSGIDYRPLQPGPMGFPSIQGCYVHISETTEPVRVEVFGDLGPGQVMEAARRVYLYSRLLPGYGFPVGLDVVDKYAKVPTWLTDAYSKLIRHHLGVSLQTGEVSDAEMRRILVQAIYMTHRDWLFRPQV